MIFLKLNILGESDKITLSMRLPQDSGLIEKIMRRAKDEGYISNLDFDMETTEENDSKAEDDIEY